MKSGTRDETELHSKSGEVGQSLCIRQTKRALIGGLITAIISHLVIVIRLK